MLHATFWLFFCWNILVLARYEVGNHFWGNRSANVDIKRGGCFQTLCVLGDPKWRRGEAGQFSMTIKLKFWLYYSYLIFVLVSLSFWYLEILHRNLSKNCLATKQCKFETQIGLWQNCVKFHILCVIYEICVKLHTVFKTTQWVQVQVQVQDILGVKTSRTQLQNNRAEEYYRSCVMSTIGAHCINSFTMKNKVTIEIQMCSHLHQSTCKLVMSKRVVKNWVFMDM